jgi:deoxycytidine triphosphate deaminase
VVLPDRTIERLIAEGRIGIDPFVPSRYRQSFAL